MTDFPFLNDDNEDIDALELFRYAVEQGCSDIHIKPGSPIRLRIKSDLKVIEGTEALNPEQTSWIVNQTMTPQIQAQYEHRHFSIDYSYDLPGIGRFRINAFKTRSAHALVARHVIDAPPTFENLNTNPVIADLANFRQGLVLISGATGSGKTTLMAAMIQAINAKRSCSIVSAEDPIEIIHKDIKASVVQREVGIDVESFGAALVDALREDPDVILIGEIRNEAEARSALKAAETGHLVISTIHGINTEKSITRFLEMFPFNERDSARTVLSGALRAIVGQKLVKDSEGDNLAVNEILLNTLQMQQAIENPLVKISELGNILEKSTVEGMQTFEQHLAELFEQGLITETTAIEGATSKEKIMPLLDMAKKKNLEASLHPNKQPAAFSERVEFPTDNTRRATAASADLHEFLKPQRPSFQLPPRA